MKRRTIILYWLLALGVSLLLGFLNVAANDGHPFIPEVLVMSCLMGYLHPKNAWQWALIIGLAVPLSYLGAPLFHYVVLNPPVPDIVSGNVLILGTAFVGAYLGVLLRRREIIAPYRRDDTVLPPRHSTRREKDNV